MMTRSSFCAVRGPSLALAPANSSVRVVTKLIETPSSDEFFFCRLTYIFFLLLSKIQVTNKIMFVIFTCMALVTTLSLVGYVVFEAEYDEKLYYLCYGDNSPVPLFA